MYAKLLDPFAVSVYVHLYPAKSMPPDVDAAATGISIKPTDNAAAVKAAADFLNNLFFIVFRPFILCFLGVLPFLYYNTFVIIFQ